ncbi:hypothetical protein ACJJTC_002775 [Scirpophaga incertulas]
MSTRDNQTPGFATESVNTGYLGNQQPQRAGLWSRRGGPDEFYPASRSLVGGFGNHRNRFATRLVAKGKSLLVAIPPSKVPSESARRDRGVMAVQSWTAEGVAGPVRLVRDANVGVRGLEFRLWVQAGRVLFGRWGGGLGRGGRNSVIFGLGRTLPEILGLEVLALIYTILFFASKALRFLGIVFPALTGGFVQSSRDKGQERTRFRLLGDVGVFNFLPQRPPGAAKDGGG